MKVLDSEIEIILIEDNPYEAEQIIQVLRGDNVIKTITHLRDDVEADVFLLKISRNLKINGNCQLILLELNMRNGIEILRKIKLDNITKTIPVVILTAAWEEKVIDTCCEIGVDGFIIKPIKQIDFITIISEVVSHWFAVNKVVNQ